MVSNWHLAVLNQVALLESPTSLEETPSIQNHQGVPLHASTGNRYPVVNDQLRSLRTHTFKFIGQLSSGSTIYVDLRDGLYSTL